MSPPIDTIKVPSFTDPSDLLSTFKFARLLSSDPVLQSFNLLGSAITSTSNEERVPTILRLTRKQTLLNENDLLLLSEFKAWEKLVMVTTNDIYATMLGWQIPLSNGAEYQISSVSPATEKHIRKYSTQSSRLFKETPQIYKEVVEPYIQSQPAYQIDWLYRILDGEAEVENVLYRDDDPLTGFVLTPDLKWDKKTLSSIYLLVLTQNRNIPSLRSIRTSHLPLLRKIKEDVERVAKETFGVGKGELRMFVHYQPTYYHFHVHVVHVSHTAHGLTVGQSHLLDEIIDNLELDLLAFPSDTEEGQSYYERKTFNYSLGDQHGLFKSLEAVQDQDVEIKK